MSREANLLRCKARCTPDGKSRFSVRALAAGAFRARQIALRSDATVSSMLNEEFPSFHEIE